MSRSDYDHSFHEFGGKMDRSPDYFKGEISTDFSLGGPVGRSPKPGSPQSSNTSSSDISSYGSVGVLGSNPNLGSLRVEVPSQHLDEQAPTYSSVDSLLHSAESRLSKASDPWSAASSWTAASTMSRYTFSPPSQQPLRSAYDALPDTSYKHASTVYSHYDQQRIHSAGQPNYPHPHHSIHVGYSQPPLPAVNYRPAFPSIPSFPVAPNFPAYPRQGGYGARGLDPHSAKFTPAVPIMAHGNMGAKGNVRRVPLPIDGYIYQVQFKRAFKNYVLGPSAPRNLMPGDFVKVEADRGEDLGVVLSKTRMEDFEEVMPTAGYRGRGFASGQGERKCILRLASAEERASVAGKVHDEE
eukprot:gene41109-50154_t